MIDKFYRWLSHRIQSRWRRKTTSLRTKQVKDVPEYTRAVTEWHLHEKERKREAAKVLVPYLILAPMFLAFLGWSMA